MDKLTLRERAEAAAKDCLTSQAHKTFLNIFADKIMHHFADLEREVERLRAVVDPQLRDHVGEAGFWGRAAARLSAKNRVLRAQVERLERRDTPWPTDSIVNCLREAVEHLLADHDCDCHGYESFNAAIAASRELSAALTASAAPDAPPRLVTHHDPDTGEPIMVVEPTDAPPEPYSCGGSRCDKGYTSPNCGCTPPEPDGDDS